MTGEADDGDEGRGQWCGGNDGDWRGSRGKVVEQEKRGGESCLRRNGRGRFWNGKMAIKCNEDS